MLLRRLAMRSPTILVAASLLMIACSNKSSAPPGAGSQVSAPSGSASTTGKTSTVLISQFRFHPETLAVNVGDTVEWKSADAVPHAVRTRDGKTINSGKIEKRAAWRFKAEKEGTYEYQCAIHPTMKARLIVQSPQSSATAKPSAAHAALVRSR